MYIYIYIHIYYLQTYVCVYLSIQSHTLFFFFATGETRIPNSSGQRDFRFGKTSAPPGLHHALYKGRYDRG